MNEDLLVAYKNSITRIFDKSTKDDIDLSKIEIKQFVSPASNTKNPIPRIFYQGDLIKKHNNFMCEYTCLNCTRSIIVCLNNITRKLNKGIIMCRICKENDDLKRTKQSEFMRMHANNICTIDNTEKLTLKNKLQNDQHDFDQVDDEFKSNYFRKHLTKDEFDRIKDKITSFQHYKFTDLSKFVYYPCVSINNQTRFNPYLYDIERDVIENITYIHFKCECCGDTFFNRDLYIQKNRYKIMCKNCSFTNKIFKIRTTKNVIGETVRYQSKLELKLIDFCNNHSVVIQNGPAIDYKFNEKKKTYRVDFQLPDLCILVECKDNHIWHKNNIESGQWNAKHIVVQDYIATSNLYKKFLIVMPKTFNEHTKYILSISNKI